MVIAADMDFREFARQVGTVMDYPAGSAIFSEGDASRSMYIVLKGAVEVSSHGRVIEVVQAGDALGIVALLDDQPRTATARASQAAELAVIDARKFRYMVKEMPNFCWYVMKELSHRLRKTNALL